VWNAKWTQSGTALSASGVDYNSTVQANGTQSFGFCAAT
jgi:endoglucanase